ncbi:hypothetical protein PLICRDRAFT_104301 [Plicaturopsis crispa FD-325 SS-3]|nr:hypothetical protein PLICRDRAFT_104301 [Plicaturopsis crispa FD-325 SS-3]
MRTYCEAPDSDISFGVQWEIGRLISTRRLRYDAISTSDLDQLSGSNTKAAPLVGPVMLKKKTKGVIQKKEFASSFPWVDFDKELEVRRKDPSGTLGCQPDMPYYYGGNIHFVAQLVRLEHITHGLPYRIELQPVTKGVSTRCTRAFGSDRLLVIKIREEDLRRPNNGLEMFFVGRAFVLHERVYRFLYRKDTSAYCIQVNDVVVEDDASHVRVLPATTSAVSSGPLPFLQYIYFFNPLACNTKQLSCKWAARFSLMFSNSIPGCKLNPSDIIEIDDIVSPEKSDMTDGCGFANRALMRALMKNLGWSSLPTAVQMRLGGAKGLLLLHPHDETSVPRAWLRKSQIKIAYSPGKKTDDAMLVVDVLRGSHLRAACSISPEIIIILADNGVPHEVLTDLFREGVRERVNDLLNWDDPRALWYAVARAGNVFAARRARENIGQARANGYGDKDDDDDVIEDEDGFDSALQQHSTAWWPDTTSGAPATLHESVMLPLAAGFVPRENHILLEKLKSIVQSTIDQCFNKYKITIPMSYRAFLVPDPFGILEPDEIYLKSSHANIVTADGLLTDVLLGDVLITRNPCRVPTDVRKVRAVDKAELAGYTDVIVCSIKGPRRSVEYFATSDFDGDPGNIISDPRIVEHFTNAPLHFSVEPECVSQSFSRSTDSVTALRQRIFLSPVDIQTQELQKVLLGPVDDLPLVGQYSDYHEKAVYRLGSRHPEAIRLGYMFCTMLDSPKTGLSLKKAAETSDRQYGRGHLAWKEGRKTVKREVDDKTVIVPARQASSLQRNPDLGVFIMDVMQDAAYDEGARQDAVIGTRFSAILNERQVPDAVLTAPWAEAKEIAQRAFASGDRTNRRMRDLDKIASHVRKIYYEHKERIRGSFTQKRINNRQDVLRDLSAKFAEGPDQSDLLLSQAETRRLKASYAYLYDCETSYNGSSRFPWDVAMRELCLLKAAATEDSKVSIEDFNSHYIMKPPFRQPA